MNVDKLQGLIEKWQAQKEKLKGVSFVGTPYEINVLEEVLEDAKRALAELAQT